MVTKDSVLMMMMNSDYEELNLMTMRDTKKDMTKMTREGVVAILGSGRGGGAGSTTVGERVGGGSATVDAICWEVAAELASGTSTCLGLAD